MSSLWAGVDFVLSYGGSSLSEDTYTLRDYNIGDQSTLYGHAAHQGGSGNMP
jgi:hypothetical protein